MGRGTALSRFLKGHRLDRERQAAASAARAVMSAPAFLWPRGGVLGVSTGRRVIQCMSLLPWGQRAQLQALGTLFREGMSTGALRAASGGREAGQWERRGKDTAVATVRGELRERVPSCRVLVVGGEVPEDKAGEATKS